LFEEHSNLDYLAIRKHRRPLPVPATSHCSSQVQVDLVAVAGCSNSSIIYGGARHLRRSSSMHPDWQRHRFWSRLTLILWLFWCANIIVFPICWALNLPQSLGYCWALGYMGFLMFASMRTSEFRCPRCGLYFFSGYWGPLPYHISFARRCVHCGLPKWADPNEEPAMHK
jgi:hypothetical protein